MSELTFSKSVGLARQRFAPPTTSIPHRICIAIPSSALRFRRIQVRRNQTIRLGKTVLPRYEAEAVMNIERSLTKLHQVFLDMAVLVEKHGEVLDVISSIMGSKLGVLSAAERTFLSMRIR